MVEQGAVNSEVVGSSPTPTVIVLESLSGNRNGFVNHRVSFVGSSPTSSSILSGIRGSHGWVAGCHSEWEASKIWS